MDILNNAMIYLSVHQTIASQCLKQPLLNELYKGFGTWGWTSPEKTSFSFHFHIHLDGERQSGRWFVWEEIPWLSLNTNQRSQVPSLLLESLISTLHSIINKKKKKTPRSVVNFNDSFHILKLEPPITAVYLMAAKESADSSYRLNGHTVRFYP